MPVSAPRKAAALLFLIAAVAGGLAILVYRLDAAERDRDAVRTFVWAWNRTSSRATGQRDC